jgi:cystathionine beta-lyase/cystathionine gamma-synthase
MSPDPYDGKTLRPATTVVSSGRPPHEPDSPLNEPLTMASTSVAGGEREYGRYGNPTWAAFEEALGELEGGKALAFSSGLAAVATILDLVGHEQKVVAPRHAYNGSILQMADLEARGRISAVLVDISWLTTRKCLAQPIISPRNKPSTATAWMPARIFTAWVARFTFCSRGIRRSRKARWPNA